MAAPSPSRRAFLTGAASAAGAVLAARAFGQDSSRTRVILLGTKGGPRVGESGRSNPSTLLLIGGVPYVVDCGYGTSRQLISAGVPLTKLRYVFVTHLHGDHALEVGPLVYNGWAAGLATRVDVYGPVGLERMVRAFLESVKYDVDVRIEDEGRPDLRGLFVTHEVSANGIYLKNAEVTVRAARVNHPPTRAYAYRFDARDRSVVVSGDTTYSDALVDLARGADVLVHEVIYPPAVEALIGRVPNAGRLREHLKNTHTPPEDVGRAAAAAGVKTLVLTHFVPGDDPSITDEQWAEGVRKHFRGTVIVGRDLLEIP
jgi:ribonuclease BN (tRNA processing enzyme)